MKKLYFLSALTLGLTAGAHGQRAMKVQDLHRAQDARSAEQVTPVNTLDETPVLRGIGEGCVLEETFDASYPATWSSVVTNTNGANFTWGWGATAGNPGGGMTMEYDPALSPQDESIITPDVDLSSIANPGLTFDWLGSYFWSVSPNDNYDIIVSISTDGGDTWTDLWTEEQEPEFANFTFYTKTISLVAYASETAARFRFRYLGVDGAQASIDNVNVCSIPGVDLAVNEVWHGDINEAYEYSKIPLAQSHEVVIGVNSSNIGASDQSGVSYNYAITRGGTEVASGTFAPTSTDIPSGGNDETWFSTGYTPDAVGTYTVTVSISSDEDDSNEANNTGSSAFEVTNTLFAHDEVGTTVVTAIFGGNDAGGQPNEFKCSVVYEVFADATMYGIQVAFGSNTNAESVSIEVFDLVNDPTRENPMIFEVYDIQPSDLSSQTTVKYINLPLNDGEGLELFAGGLYQIALGNTAGENLVFVASDDDDDASTIMYGPYGENDAIGWYIGWDFSPVIRANFDPSVSIAETIDLAGIQMFPNPVNDVLTVRFTAQDQNDVRINLVSLDGKLVYTENVKSFSGQHTSLIDMSGLPSGIYSVQLMSNNGTHTQKVVVVK